MIKKTLLVLSLLLVLLFAIPIVRAEDQPLFEIPQIMVIPEATKGFDENKVKQDPICDSSTRPTIFQVKPDVVKTGDKITISGTNFNIKAKCLYSVTIGSSIPHTITYLDNNSFEMIVPNTVNPGLVFINVVAGGGSARTAILVKG